MKTVELYSVKEGKTVEWELSIDAYGDIVATHTTEQLKFPSGMTKKELQKAFEAHNLANEGRVAKKEGELDENEKVVLESKKLLESL